MAQSRKAKSAKRPAGRASAAGKRAKKVSVKRVAKTTVKRPVAKAVHKAAPKKAVTKRPVTKKPVRKRLAPEGKTYHLPAHLIVSPDITKHPWQNRRDYLILVASIAASDSELHPDELKLLEVWMERFELPDDARAEVLHVANRGEIDLVQPATRLAGTALTWSVMLDMMGMAMADGVLMDDEILLLRGLANVLQIDPIDFNILIEFVHSAHQGAQLSNPEPLYEHAIESAFLLLSKRHVRLFEHTRLCVNYPDYDRTLKERWATFKPAEHAA